MGSLRRRFIVVAAIFTAGLAIPVISLSAETPCSAPIPDAPHQGGGQSASTVFGAQADITYQTVVFGCQTNWDSYTNEWVMVVGPGPGAWIQVGWERDEGYYDHAPHIWYQYMGPNTGGPIEGHMDPAVYPLGVVRTYRIEAVTDPGGPTDWLLWADNMSVGSIAAAVLGWPGAGQYGSDAQWSGEVSYAESDMGGSYRNPAHIAWPMWTLGGGWSDITAPYQFNSEHPRYAGDAYQFSDQTWLFRNWSWYRIFLPLILNSGAQGGGGI